MAKKALEKSPKKAPKKAARDTSARRLRLVLLMRQYQELARKARGSKDASVRRRVRQLRKRIDDLIDAGGIDVSRTIYLGTRQNGRLEMRRIAGGKNLNVRVVQPPSRGQSSAEDTGHGGDQTPACGSACDNAMNDHDTQNQVCICDCSDSGDATIAIVTCVGETGTLPE